ncbi:hypothetical protein [Bradyrhizobium japonicum]|uniref:hypothetical protein n=1 Tax=Bradyrhizobium japonicum TaxID=375 RepID=UPI001BA55CE2|nr:hypothetical protein [Bradyrhizobium japonicum]MBR0958378.1 hypothetical protein [Bradyrhizobium japonicum]
MALDEDPDPEQAADQAQTSTPENKANEDPSTSKPFATPPSPGPASQAMDPDDVAAIEELDDHPSHHTGRPDWRRVAKLAGQSKTVRKERTRERDLHLKELENAALLRIRADRKRTTDSQRQQRHRASKDAQNQKALERLMRATSNPAAHPQQAKRLEQLRGNEVAYTRFYGEFCEARESGAKTSGQKLADLYNDAWGENINRDTAIRWKQICLDLEAKGGPWFVRQGPTKRSS